ncbi:hypothetical protein LTR27_012254 [Elasticomyces elasticus]|nr:hypothetical protein LTR27_012254 [Elasticomyces elasticus]
MRGEDQWRRGSRLDLDLEVEECMVNINPDGKACPKNQEYERESMIDINFGRQSVGLERGGSCPKNQRSTSISPSEGKA